MTRLILIDWIDRSSASTGPRFFSTHSHPAGAGYTKLNELKHYRDKYLFFLGKTVAGFRSEENAKPSSHTTEPKAPSC